MRAPSAGSMVTMRTTAADAYAAAQVEARALLSEIAHHLAAHRDAHPPAEVEWDAVGDLHSVVARLKELRDFIAVEG